MSKTLSSSIRHYRLLFACAVAVLGLDQLSKLWIAANIPYDTYSPPEAITVIEGFFYIIHVGNEGAAWGMLSGHGWLLALFAVIALAAIYWFRELLSLPRPMMQFAFGILIGGIVGNLIDRITRLHVVDFLDFHLPFTIPVVLPTGRYPTFNIADCGIVVGTFIYFFYSLYLDRKERNSATEPLA